MCYYPNAGMHLMIKLRILVTLVTLSAAARSASADFIVRDVHSSGSVRSLADADALLAGNRIASEATASRPFIDLFDPAASTSGGDGHFSNDLTFPDASPGIAGKNFAIHATTSVVIVTPGTYTFGINSDDGARLRIDQGAGFATLINDSNIHAAQDHFGTDTFASPGTYALDLVYFQAGGAATVELFAAQGSFTAFDSSAFRLVGDSANGGLATIRAVPEPSSILMLGAAGLVLLCYDRRRRTRLARRFARVIVDHRRL